MGRVLFITDSEEKDFLYKNALKSHEYQISCAYDEENWELVNWTVTDSSGESTASTLNNKTFTSDATVTVTLAKIEAFIATCPAVPSGCSYKVRGGTTTSDETVATADMQVKGEKGQPQSELENGRSEPDQVQQVRCSYDASSGMQGLWFL